MTDKEKIEHFRKIIGVAIGRASVCWDELPTGVFDSTTASQLVNEIVAAAVQWRDENPSPKFEQLEQEMAFQFYQKNQACDKVLALVEALRKIADPRLRDHREPDKYTECACIMNMAEEALADWEKK